MPQDLEQNKNKTVNLRKEFLTNKTNQQNHKKKGQIMKVSKTLLALLALPMFSAAMAAEAPKPTMAPGAKQIQAAPKTMDEALKFLPAVVMEVGGKKITKAQVVDTLKKMVPEQFVGRLPDAQLKQMVQGMLDLEIMGALAAKNGYAPSEAAVKAMLKAEMAKLTPDQKKQLDERMKAAGKTVDKFVDELAKNKEAQKEIAINKWVMEKIAPTVKVSDADALKFYNDNKANFVKKETITASHILIQPEKKGDKASEQKAEAKAKAVLAQLKQGADFGTLAEIESACPSGKRAKGSLGKMEKDGLDKDFWNAAIALKKGTISDVVKTQFGYHIIRLEDKTAAEPVKFEDMKNDIMTHLKNEQTNRKVADAIKQAKASGFAKVSKF